jgi:hypothetical protein
VIGVPEGEVGCLLASVLSLNQSSQNVDSGIVVHVHRIEEQMDLVLNSRELLQAHLNSYNIDVVE